MKYFVGTLDFSEHASPRTHSGHVLVATQDATLAARAMDAHIAAEHEGNAHDVSTADIQEISAAAFFGMKGIPRIGAKVEDDLLVQNAPEQAKTLARRLKVQFERLGLDGLSELSHNRLLHAVAASLGETDWQALKHKGIQPAPIKESTVPGVDVASGMLGDLSGTTTLQLGMVTHHHKHGEDHFFFQSVPDRQDAVDAVCSSSSFEPEYGESIDIKSIFVNVDLQWLSDHLIKDLQTKRGVNVTDVTTLGDRPFVGASAGSSQYSSPVAIHLTQHEFQGQQNWYWSVRSVETVTGPIIDSMDGFIGIDWGGPYPSVNSVVDALKAVIDRAKPGSPFEHGFSLSWSLFSPSEECPNPLNTLNPLNPVCAVLKDGFAYSEGVRFDEAVRLAQAMRDDETDVIWTVEDLVSGELLAIHMGHKNSVDHRSGNKPRRLRP